MQENLARKVYKQRLDEIRTDYSKDVDNEVKKYDSAVRQEIVDFEKMRCEKRLLEDKYNTLKEKYMKMKKDMRAAIEKRNRRKEQANATASETEMSTSTRTRTDRTESTDQKLVGFAITFIFFSVSHNLESLSRRFDHPNH